MCQKECSYFNLIKVKDRKDLPQPTDQSFPLTHCKEKDANDCWFYYTYAITKNSTKEVFVVEKLGTVTLSWFCLIILLLAFCLLLQKQMLRQFNISTLGSLWCNWDWIIHRSYIGYHFCAIYKHRSLLLDLENNLQQYPKISYPRERRWDGKSSLLLRNQENSH